jgi:Bifunctional DNA primase/polymerase, N-terminal/AAA domain
MTRIFSDYVSSYPDTPIFRSAIALVRNGYAVVPVEPGGKAPMCTLTARERNAEIRTHGGHGAGFAASPCGVYHYITDDRVAEHVFKRLAKQLDREPNIGIVAQPSRLVVVDADTPEAVDSFLHRWCQAEEDEGYLTRSPTVSTPGSRRGEEWRHRHGGHWYFALPEGIELPTTPGQLQLPGGSDVRWGMLMTVAPPSVRPEGPYIVHGDIPDVPGFLLHAAREAIERQVFRAVELSERYANDSVVAWSIETPWAALLLPCGWTDTNKLDRCGCPIFEKPGGGSSGPKSATAHVGTCSVMDNIEGHGALHLWTTEPPPELDGRRNVTKLQFVALINHDGDEAAAERELGLIPDYEALWEGLSSNRQPPGGVHPEIAAESQEPPAGDGEMPPEQGKQASASSSQANSDVHPLTALARNLADRIGVPFDRAKKAVGDEWLRREAREEVGRYLDGTELRDGSSWSPRGDLAAAMADPMVEVNAEGVLRREDDDATLFPRGQLHVLFGQSESGKSWLALLAIVQVCRAGGRALYVDFEDSVRTFVKRLRDDLRVPELDSWVAKGRLAYASPDEPPSTMTADTIASRHYDLVIVDSWAEVVAAIKDGSLKDGTLTRRVMRLFRTVAEAGASVIIIAHASEKTERPETTLGASEQKQAVTGQEVLMLNSQPLVRGRDGSSLLYVTKDRQGATADDVDVTAAGARAHKRLWGEMLVGQADVLTADGHPDGKKAAVIVRAATHDPKIARTRAKAKDVAEQEIIKHLNALTDKGQEGASVNRIVQQLVDVEGLKERTVRRAIDSLVEEGMLHVDGETPAGPTGGRPSPIIKLGPTPEPPPSA